MSASIIYQNTLPSIIGRITPITIDEQTIIQSLFETLKRLLKRIPTNRTTKTTITYETSIPSANSNKGTTLSSSLPIIALK